jgi:Arc/MetJ-type ribon-helix-helix transcriptional regulator
VKDVRLAIRVDAEMHAALEALAERQPDVTVSDLVRRAIRELLARETQG